MADEQTSKDEHIEALTRALLTVREQERSHLARELHDDLGQYLTGIRSLAYALAQHCRGVADQPADELMQYCDHLQAGFKRLIHERHPAVLVSAGLTEAIHQLVRNGSATRGVEVSVRIDAACDVMTEDNRVHIYRIVQEALHNISRHADATHASVDLAADDKAEFVLRICDNGRGIQNPGTAGFGLRSMRERARLIGGFLNVDSSESGLCLTLRVPEQECAV